MSVKTHKYNTSSPGALLTSIMELNWFSFDKSTNSGCLPATFNPSSDPNCKCLIVTGLNATGKSLVRRIIQSVSRKLEWEPIHLSMEKRTGDDGTYGPMKVMMFGSENDQATGGISAHTILMGISTAVSRQNPHTVFFDEPDLGLSDEYAIDAAVRIANLSKLNNTNTKLVGVVTHRKCMLETLQHEMGQVHHLHMGLETPKNLGEWINRDIKRLSLEELKTREGDTFRTIHRQIQANKK